MNEITISNTTKQPKGFFEIGIDHPAHSENIGTLWRSAYQLGAAGIFNIGQPKEKTSADTQRTWCQIPYRISNTFDDFYQNLPFSTQLIGIEIGGTPITQFVHPDRCVYLLGSEHNGLSKKILSSCHAVISLESVRSASYNVAVAGSLVMFHRYMQRNSDIK